MRIAGVPSPARCNLEELPPGRTVNVDTGKPLDEADRCTTRGLVAGPDPAAGKAVRDAVRALLVERFRLAP